MSKSPETHVTVEEELPLNTVAGSGNAQNHQAAARSGRCNAVAKAAAAAASCCRDDKHHRKLAVCSIVCGISCIGIIALISSVKAEETVNRDRAAAFTKRAKKFGTMSIAIWVSILVLTPTLMALISYLLTLQD